MIQLQNIRNRSKPLQQVGDVSEVLTQLDEWCGGKHSLAGHDQVTMIWIVEVRHQQKQVTRPVIGRY